MGAFLPMDFAEELLQAQSYPEGIIAFWDEDVLGKEGKNVEA